MASPRFDETLRVVDDLRGRCRRREVSPADFTNEITDAFYDYLLEEDPRDDVVSLLDYCVKVAHEVCDLTLFGDRVLPQRLEHQLHWILEQQGDAESLGQLVRRLRARLEADDELARIDLVELCQHGYETHPGLFSAVDTERDVIELAWEFMVVPALDAAVRPTSSGRLASEEKSRGKALPRTLDLLAHLANEPQHPSGNQARDSLISLCGHPETAALAALRLPVHLLSDEQRSRLHDIYVAQEESIGPELVRIFVSEQQLRDREILRSALWQANDARALSSPQAIV